MKAEEFEIISEQSNRIDSLEQQMKYLYDTIFGLMEMMQSLHPEIKEHIAPLLNLNKAIQEALKSLEVNK